MAYRNFTLVPLLLCLLLSLSSSIKGECPLPDHPLALGELIDIALTNHPSTKQAWWNANRAAALLGSAKSAYYPNVALEGIVKNGRDFKFINGPDTNYTIIGADLILTMLLYDYGERLANVNAAKAALIAANWQSDWNIQKVMIKVLENAYATLHAEEVVRGTTISLEEANKILEYARALNTAGLSPVSDVYTSLATVAQMKIELSQQIALMDIQKGQLVHSLGLEPSNSIELASLAPIEIPQLLPLKELISLGLQRRADLMAKQANVTESISYQKLARAAYGPKISFCGRTGANHAINDHANAAQYQLFLNVSMPLFNGFDTMYQNRMAYADTELSMESLAELELDIALEVFTHTRSVLAAEEMLANANEYLLNSQKSYESSLEKYRAGKEWILEVSNAQQKLAAARIRYSDIKTRVLLSVANLAYATGTLNTEGSCK